MAGKLMTSRTLSASFPSPESPQCSDYDKGVEQSKGWYSERVPQPSQKRYVAASALMPFRIGRALPSKWDDAERWISSPVSVGNVSSSGNISNYYKEGVGVHKNSLSAHFQGRAKSKSGPLGPGGAGVYGGYNTFSPVLGVGVIHGGKLWRSSLAMESPAFAVTGDGVCEGRRRSLPGQGDPEWLDLWSGPLSPSEKGKVSDGMVSVKNPPSNNSRGYNDDVANVSRRDMATQMYPESESSSSHSSVVSSPRSTISTNSPFPLRRELNMNVQFSELEVKYVQVEKQTSRQTKWSSPLDSQVKEDSSSSTSREGDNTISRLQREEARINAWENLQKAKAESSIQKLEMKLEKKRASSLNKIIEKLRRTKIKAQKMRIKNSLSNDSNQVQSRAILKTTSKISSFCRRFRISSLTKSCCTCYPF